MYGGAQDTRELGSTQPLCLAHFLEPIEYWCFAPWFTSHSRQHKCYVAIMQLFPGRNRWASKPEPVVQLFGHSTQLRIFIDPDLLQYDEVWAATGTRNDVFPIAPDDLVRASAAVVTDPKRVWFYARYHFIGFDLGSRFNWPLASRSN